MNTADVPVLSPVSERKWRTRCIAYANYAITRCLYSIRIVCATDVQIKNSCSSDIDFDSDSLGCMGECPLRLGDF